jgi:hypothetical protein
MKWESIAGIALALAAGTASGAGLPNTGFEDDSPTSEWERNVYGAPPMIESDAAIFHEGRRSLRIQALQPSDTALGWEITLQPSRWYRSHDWVRTRGLDPHGSATSATLQVQLPLGRGVIASGASHAGDTDWAAVQVHFQAPPDGRVRLCLFFVGFGRGTGTVWFDDLELDEVQPGNATIRLTLDPLMNATISPLQYGHFVEYLCDLVPSMWSEQLFDGGFEGLSPYKFAFIAETDLKERPWYPVGAVNRATYTSDRTNKISGLAAADLRPSLHAQGLRSSIIIPIPGALAHGDPVECCRGRALTMWRVVPSARLPPTGARPHTGAACHPKRARPGSSRC